jgi:hypothetical protein
VRFPTRLTSLEKYDPVLIRCGFYQTFALTSIQVSKILVYFIFSQTISICLKTNKLNK